MGKVELAIITSHCQPPRDINEIKKKLGIKVRWTGWTKCLQSAQAIARGPETDPASQQSLNELAEYRETLEVKVQTGFAHDHDWTSSYRLMYNSGTLLNEVTRIIKEAGFKTPNDYWPHWEYRELTFWGKWVYSESTKEGETGVWFGIGLIDGLNQIEFAAYEEEGKQNLHYLEGKGYRLTQKFWSKGYDYYSKYLPIASLASYTYDGQEGRIIDFVKACL